MRAELKLLGGHYAWHQTPSPAGSATASTPAPDGNLPATVEDAPKPDKAKEETKGADASDLIEVGAPSVPYATASLGTLRDKVSVVESWDKTDMRKHVAERRENIQALSNEAKSTIVTDELMAEHKVTPNVRVIMPGSTADNLSKTHAASNTHENALAAASVRHCGEQHVEWQYADMKISEPCWQS